MCTILLLVAFQFTDLFMEKTIPFSCHNNKSNTAHDNYYTIMSRLSK